MQLAMVGLGRMGFNMALRLHENGQACMGFDPAADPVRALRAAGLAATSQLIELLARLQPPRVLWLMVPTARVQSLLAELTPQLAPGDLVIDGGNSCWQDALPRAQALAARGIGFMDIGTSGGIAGRERGYCLMAGGTAAAFAQIEPALLALAPGVAAAAALPGRDVRTGTASAGYLHCGPHGAGHFVKMVHNGIEYGMMAAYAEGLSVLHGANIGAADGRQDAETAPLAHPEHYRYPLELADIAELWRRGSVVGSWLLDLTAQALQMDPELLAHAGGVADSGEGRWMIQAAIDIGVPVPITASALFDRFASRGQGQYGHRVLSAMRSGFGGHPSTTESG